MAGDRNYHGERESEEIKRRKSRGTTDGGERSRDGEIKRSRSRRGWQDRIQKGRQTQRKRERERDPRRMWRAI